MAIDGGIISGIGNFLGSGVNAWSQYHTNRFQKKESELAFQRDQQQIKEQNFYNHPSQQMARIKAAGLSPHLMYGQGTVGNMEQTAQYTPAKQQAPQYGDMASKAVKGGLEAYTGLRMNQANVDNVESQTRNQDAQNTGIYTNNAIAIVDLEKGRSELRVLMATEPERALQYQKSIDMIDAQIANISSGINRNTHLNAETDAKTQSVITDTKTLDQRNKAQIANLTSKTNLNNNQATKVVAEINKIGADIGLTQAQTSHEKIKQGKTLTEKEKIQYDKAKAELELRISTVLGSNRGSIPGIISGILGASIDQAATIGGQKPVNY